jgi:hypothetical protein
MLYAGLDLSRQRLDVHVLDEEGRTIEVTAATPEVFGLRELVARISRHGDEVTGVIESMNGGPLRPRPARARRLASTWRTRAAHGPSGSASS